jgi:hypothetical protein
MHFLVVPVHACEPASSTPSSIAILGTGLPAELSHIRYKVSLCPSRNWHIDSSQAADFPAKPL